MQISDEMLSAFLDGELPEETQRAVEAALDQDRGLQSRLETLMSGDRAAQEAFDAMLDEPVPMALAAAIRKAEMPGATPAAEAAPSMATLDSAPRARPLWQIAASVLLALGIGAGGGFFFGRESAVEVAQAPGWLAQIADYHAVYAAQERHLVEVPAEEAAHIETWLSATLEVPVAIPDLSAAGLEFEGARLLVAAGRPVSQLIYTDAVGAVVALCQIATPSPAESFASREIDGFELVSWGGAAANFVIVGDAGRADLTEIAEAAAGQLL